MTISARVMINQGLYTIVFIIPDNAFFISIAVKSFIRAHVRGFLNIYIQFFGDFRVLSARWRGLTRTLLSVQGHHTQESINRWVLVKPWASKLLNSY
ncbi:MAG: hypothetical protein AYK19_14745 [Theionarchaea archaeon DG-70-1]|nr:MAG: hypothetical protein AYK19_14745 [Theionarchaea archaeon DG-70-1]